MFDGRFVVDRASALHRSFVPKQAKVTKESESFALSFNLCSSPATIRGFPRKIVAANFAAATTANDALSKSAFFPQEYVNVSRRCFRGTAIANGGFIMKPSTPADVKASDQCSTPSDWLRRYGDYLFNFAVGQVRDVTVAEDLVQETFLAALKARDQFGGRSSERTWLVSILRHKIYDHLRRICRERSVRHDPSPAQPEDEAWDESVLWMHDVNAECVSPSRRMELNEFREALEMALGRLPSRLAQVFQMYEIEEQPNRKVCDELQISESNLWVMLHRARKQLRKELGAWWHGTGRQSRSIP